MKLFNLLVKCPEITSCAVIVKISVQMHKPCSRGPRFVYGACGRFPRSVVHVFWFLRSYASKPAHYNCFKKHNPMGTQTTGLIKPHNHEAQKACTQDTMTCVAFVLKQKKKSSNPHHRIQQCFHCSVLSSNIKQIAKTSL